MSVKHKVKYRKVGTPNSGDMTPYCSCGWEGSTWSNRHPNQFECVNNEGAAHLNSFKETILEKDRPIVSFENVLKQRKIEGKSLIIIEPETSNKEVLDALKKMLPNDKQEAVVLVDFSKNTPK